MIGDNERADMARIDIELRAVRRSSFSSDLFDEYPWIMLLYTFIAHTENDTISVFDLYDRADVRPALASRWLAHLIKSGQMEHSNDNQDVRLTLKSVSAMRDYFDNVRALSERVFVDRD